MILHFRCMLDNDNTLFVLKKPNLRGSWPAIGKQVSSLVSRSFSLPPLPCAGADEEARGWNISFSFAALRVGSIRLSGVTCIHHILLGAGCFVTSPASCVARWPGVQVLLVAGLLAGPQGGCRLCYTLSQYQTCFCFLTRFFAGAHC